MFEWTEHCRVLHLNQSTPNRGGARGRVCPAKQDAFAASPCKRERWFVWHGIVFEEPNPTGSRPRDLIGLYKQQKETPPPQHTREGKGSHGKEKRPKRRKGEATETPRDGDRRGGGDRGSPEEAERREGYREAPRTRWVNSKRRLIQSYTHTQRTNNQRVEKVSQRAHPMETETQTRKMVLRQGGTPLVTQSGLDRRPECTG